MCISYLELILQVSVLEGELALDALAPASLVVEVNIRPLLVLLGGHFGLLVPLEPRQVLLVVPPRLLLQLARGEVLLVGAPAGNKK